MSLAVFLDAWRAQHVTAGERMLCHFSQAAKARGMTDELLCSAEALVKPIHVRMMKIGCQKKLRSIWIGAHLFPDLLLEL